MAEEAKKDAKKPAPTQQQDSSKPMDTETKLSDMYNNEVLSDMSLVNPTTKG